MWTDAKRKNINKYNIFKKFEIDSKNKRKYNISFTEKAFFFKIDFFLKFKLSIHFYFFIL
jgi:hypothetical protein